MKKKVLRKIFIASAALFALMLIYLIPDKESNSLTNQNLEYIQKEINTLPIFLLDINSYLGKTKVVINSTDVTSQVKELMEILIKGGELENRIPSGFASIIPSETQILSIKQEDDIIKIDFSKQLLDVSQDLEEKIIEAIVYTITSIEQIQKVIIYVEGEILTTLPQSKITLPPILDRNIGINKTFNFTKREDINQVTTYYINKHNDYYYYVPVTNYTNDNREKIEIVIEQLSSSNVYNTNLLSYVNYQTKLINATQDENIMNLNFNSYIFNDIENKDILEEVIYTISLSVMDNYDVTQINFSNLNEIITTTVLKDLD